MFLKPDVSVFYGAYKTCFSLFVNVIIEHTWDLDIRLRMRKNAIDLFSHMYKFGMELGFQAIIFLNIRKSGSVSFLFPMLFHNCLQVLNVLVHLLFSSNLRKEIKALF